MESTDETNPFAVQTFEGCRSNTKYIVPIADFGVNADTSRSVKSKAVKCVCIDDIVQFEKDEHRQYTCGGCSHKFITVCILHEHLKLHGSGGSYHFDHVSNTAIPKYDTFCSFTQTDTNFYNERTDAPLASLSDEEASYHGYNDYEASDETGAQDQDVNVSSDTDKDSDLFTNLMSCKHSDKDAKMKTENKETCLKIVKVVLKDINNSIKEARKKGLSIDLKVRDHNNIEINKTKLKTKESTSKPPLAWRNRRHAYPKQSKKLTKEPKGPEKAKPADNDPDYDIDEVSDVDDIAPVSKTSRSLPRKKPWQERNTGRTKKRKLRDKKKTPNIHVSLDLDYQIDDVDTSDLDDIKSEPRDMPALEYLDITSKETGEAELINIEEKHREVLVQCVKDEKPEDKFVKIKCEIEMENDNDQIKKVSKAKKRKKGKRMKGNEDEVKEGNERLECELCHKRPLKRNIQRHMASCAAKKAKFEEAKRRLPCEICKVTVKEKNFKKHMLRHAFDTESVICDHCGQPYARKQMKNHLITHLAVKPFQCALCPAQFSGKELLESHMARHTGVRSHVCNVCDMGFYNQKGLKRHINSVHMGVKKHQCDVCNRTFFRKTNMESHRANHFEPKEECKICHRMFRGKTSLIRHARIHTGLKMYMCHICDHGFNQSTPYFSHMEKHHGMSRPVVKKILEQVHNANKCAGETVRVKPIMIPQDYDSGVMSQSAATETEHANPTVYSAVDTAKMAKHKQKYTSVSKFSDRNTVTYNAPVTLCEPRQTDVSASSFTQQQTESILAIQALQESQNYSILNHR